MTAIIRESHVYSILSSWIGETLAAQTSIVHKITAFLQEKANASLPLEVVAKQTEERIFRELFHILGPTMRVQTENGTIRRIQMSDLPQLVDDLLVEPMSLLPVTQKNDQLLREYILAKSSRSALAVEYAHFSAFQTTEERLFLERIVKERYAIGWRPNWLALPL